MCTAGAELMFPSSWKLFLDYFDGELVDDVRVSETGWTYVPQDDEKRALALTGDLKEFTSSHHSEDERIYERILTNTTQECAAFAKLVSADKWDSSKPLFWTYTAAEKECAVATNIDYRQRK